MGDTTTTQNDANTKEQGVTLVELLVVIAIMGIVAGMPIVTMLAERHRATLDEGHATVLQALNTTRSRAVSGAGGVDTVGHVACVRDAEEETFAEVEIFTADECPGNCGTCSGGETYLLPRGVRVDEARIPFKRLTGESEHRDIEVTGFESTRPITVSNHGFIQ